MKREHSEPPISESISPRPETDTGISHAVSVEQQSERTSCSVPVGPSYVADFQKIYDAALKKQSEEMSAALYAQAAHHQANLQVLQRELDVAKVGLEQNVIEMHNLGDQSKDMKGHINKRSSVICSLEVQEEKLEKQVERLEKKIEKFQK